MAEHGWLDVGVRVSGVVCDHVRVFVQKGKVCVCVCVCVQGLADQHARTGHTNHQPGFGHQSCGRQQQLVPCT